MFVENGRQSFRARAGFNYFAPMERGVSAWKCYKHDAPSGASDLWDMLHDPRQAPGRLKLVAAFFFAAFFFAAFFFATLREQLSVSIYGVVASQAVPAKSQSRKEEGN
jgi:hypothetical protein